MLWNHWVDLHESSKFYDVSKFAEAPFTLKETELKLLGDLHDRSLLHLMCHFGQDSLSLAQLAAEVTAVDFSEKAIELAKKTAIRCEIDVNFRCQNVNKLKLNRAFDEIFMSYGVIDWLPDLKRLSASVSTHLKSGGRFTLVEFHPLATMLDQNAVVDPLALEIGKPHIETVNHSYTGDKMLRPMTEITWPYKISDLINSFLKKGLRLTFFEEYNFSHFNCFPNLIEVSKDKFQFNDLRKGISMMYAIQFIKP